MAETFLDSMGTLKGSAKTGEADLKLSAAVRDSYVNAIHDFRNTLNDQLIKINSLSSYLDPGGFESAQQTKSNLEHGCNEFKRVIGDYKTYLDELADTVTEAASRLIASG